MKDWLEELSVFAELYNRRINNGRAYILWVDDNPFNNKDVIIDLQEKGIVVDLAITTDQGLKLFKEKEYAAIITDTSRGGKFDAGYQLCLTLQSKSDVPPVLLYSVEDTIKKYGHKYQKIGVKFMTSNCVELRKKIFDIVGDAE